MSFCFFLNYFQGHCRRVICPRDQYVRNNQCVPLYHSITGLDINVKIEISLIDRVLKSIDSDVLFELRKIVNTSLAKYVTLQPREITVWYGPKQSKVRDKYYMFDIYLFNSSSTIDFGASVEEIRAFYNNLRTHDIIHLLNGDHIQIEIHFNHRIVYKFKNYYDMSISGDGSLRVLEGRPMEDREDRPSMLVSNVNWCYRVPFDIVNETDPIGKEDYSIKPAGITVYKHQYDIPQDTKQSLLYLCSDLFINRIDKDNSDKTADDLTILKPDIDDDNNIMALSIPANIAIIAACLGLCIVFALCKIHYTSIKPREQSGTQAIPVFGNASNVVISEDRTQQIEMVGQELGITDSIELSETETN